MTLHVVPVGISILASKLLDPALRRKVDEGEWETVVPQLRDHVRHRHPTRADVVPGPSAEVDSLRDLGIKPDDRLLLLASDTDTGVRAAELVARVAPARAAPPAVVTTRDAWTDQVCVVARVPMLRPDDRATFPTGLANMAGFIGLIPHKTRDREVVHVHLSGGFKAVLVHLVALTEVLAGMLPGQVHASILWDHGLERLDVPLRRVNIEALRNELMSDWTTNVYGSGYLHTNGRLTELGHAVCVLVGTAKP